MLHTYTLRLSHLLIPECPALSQALSQHRAILLISHTTCVTKSRAVLQCGSVSLSHQGPLGLSHCLLTPSPGVSNTFRLTPCHALPARVTHTVLVSSPCCTLSHVISLSHIWSLNVLILQIVYQAPPTSRCHTRSLSGNLYHLTDSHTPLHVTYHFIATPNLWLSHKTSQGHTATPNLRRHAQPHSSTLSHRLLASHAIFRCHPRSSSVAPALGTPPRVSTERASPGRPDGHTGAPAARRATHPAGASAAGGGGNPRAGNTDTVGTEIDR